jgi:hypothetical protein
MQCPCHTIFSCYKPLTVSVLQFIVNRYVPGKCSALGNIPFRFWDRFFCACQSAESGPAGMSWA